MRFFTAVLSKDLRRRLTDPVALVIWIGIPIVIAGMMSLVTGGGDGVVPKAHVLLVDEDNSFLSNLVAGVGQGGMGEFLEVEKVALEAGQSRIDAGEATALLIIPKGFQDAVLQQPEGEEFLQSELVLLTHPAQRILPSIVEEGLEIFVEGVFYLQQLLGPSLQEIAAGPPAGQSFFPNQDVAALAVEINERLQSLEGILFPPVLQVESPIDETDAAAPSFNFGQIFLPGILFMSILFIVQGMSGDLWAEKEAGTLRRTLSTPQSLGLLLSGKLAAGALLVALVALVGLVLAVAWFDLGAARLVPALLWCSFAGGVLYCLFLLIQMLAGSRQTANLLSTVLLFPLVMIGGSFFPFEAMPDWMAAIGRFTPNGLAVVRLKEILFGEPALGSMLQSIAGIAIPASVAFVLCVRRLVTFAVGG